VITDGYTKTRSQQWEDEAPAESRLRRVQQSVPPTGRVLPGMPLEMVDPDDDDSPCLGESRFGGKRFGSPRFEGPKRPWWRPAGTVGRVFLGLGVLAVLGGLATSFIILKTYLGRDSRFRIEGAGNIEATGLTEVSRAEMLPVFGEDIGRNIFFVPLAERRKQLEQISWVERATVMRLLPDRIRIDVVERQPVAFARQGQHFGLVDANGVLLTMPAAAMAERHYSFPVVTGINANDQAVVRKARMAVYMRLLAELDADNRKLSAQISEIDLTDAADARVLMPEQGADILAHYGEDHFLERYQRYKAHIIEWRQQYPKLAAVDLRYDQQVVLEMAPGSSAGQTATVDSNAVNAGETKAASADSAKKADAQPVQDGAKSAQLAKSASGKLTFEKPASSKVTTGNAATGKALQAKPVATAKPMKAGAKTGGKNSAKPTKPASKTAKEKAAKVRFMNMKRAAEAKHTALNENRRKTAPTTSPVVVAAEGE
jgi:cell division protein FtsQ